MRFLSLDLRAFGPFLDAPVLPLDGGNRGLHLIHGPNEAGKSTTLRAIRCLLFGFPRQMADNHRHAYDKLRVGATLKNEDGTEIAFLRRKKDVKPIWTLDDGEALPDDVLAHFLAGLDAARFNDLFAMDHDELVQGGRAIIEGKGQLAELLFAAGSGLARVDEVRKGLDAEVEALFKKTGTNPTINAGLAALKLAGDAADQAMLATQAWVDLDARLALQIARKADVDAQIRQLDQEKRRLERVRDALPLIARRNLAADQLARLGPVPVLSDGFAGRRFEAASSLIASQRASQDAQRAIESVDRDLANLGPPDPALLEADAIRRVRDDLGLYRKALEDRPTDLARLTRLEAEAQALLNDLNPGATTLENADALRVPPALKERIQTLAQDHSRVEDRCDLAEREVADILTNQNVFESSTKNPDAPRLAEALSQAIERATCRGDLEALKAEAIADLGGLERQAEHDLHTLPLWSGTLEQLEALAIPSSATLDRFETNLRTAEEAVKRIEAEQTTLETERIKLDRKIAHAPGGEVIPTQEDLHAIRQAREATWQAVRGHWLDGQAIADPSRVARDHEAHVKAADDLADRLRREADLVAQQAQRQFKRLEMQDRIESLAKSHIQAQEDQKLCQIEWTDAWRSTGITPLTPREMKDWVLQGHASLTRQARAIRDRRADVEAIKNRIDEHQQEIGRLLERLGEIVVDPREHLDAVLDRARGAVARVARSARLATARGAMARAEADRLTWRNRWSEAVAPLSLPGDSAPSEAHAIIRQLEDLSNKLREVRDVRVLIDDHTRKQTRFEAAVEAVVARIATSPSSTPRSAEATARDLVERLERAHADQVRREGFQQRRADEQARWTAAKSAIDRAEGAIGALIQEARCEDAEGLIEAERRSDEVKGLVKDLRSIDEQLSILAGAGTIDRLCQEAAGADADSISLQIETYVDQLQPLETERDTLGEEVGRCRERLDAMDGGPKAADARQEVEGRVAALTADVEQYARLRLASAVLREAVERHRSKNQGPVLDRAGSLFARFTDGSFAGLRADVDDKANPVLRGLRADGTTQVAVEGMSEGTADQLYLALRLASLETYMDHHEPMPLIVDDILVHFDNARATAALLALAELSHRTQILFFTHHEHLVDLARAAISPETLFVHRLSLTSTPPLPLANGHTEPPRARRKVVK